MLDESDGQSRATCAFPRSSATSSVWYGALYSTRSGTSKTRNLRKEDERETRFEPWQVTCQRNNVSRDSVEARADVKTPRMVL